MMSENHLSSFSPGVGMKKITKCKKTKSIKTVNKEVCIVCYCFCMSSGYNISQDDRMKTMYVYSILFNYLLILMPL